MEANLPLGRSHREPEQQSLREIYDFIIVGSGAGGAVAARYLSGKGKEVLLLEEGDPDPDPGGVSIGNSLLASWREAGAIPIFGNSSLVFGEGRCLGGSTVINAGLIDRTPQLVVDSWNEKFKLKELDHSSLNKCHEEIEAAIGEFHREPVPSEVGRRFQAGAHACGYEGSFVPVAGSLASGKRTMPHTLLADARKNGATILAGSRVEKIFFRGGGAERIRVRNKDGIFQVRCRNLILAAGAIQTPLLLRRSGVRKNIGRRLQFHPTLRVVCEFENEIESYLEPMSNFQVKDVHPSITLGASISTPAYLISGLSVNQEANKSAFDRLKKMAIFYVGVSSQAKGRVCPLPLPKESYFVRYNLDRQDLAHFQLGYEKLAEILFAAGAERLFPSVRGLPFQARLFPLPEGAFQLDHLNLVAVHAYGSCPMGETPEAALDSFGKLRDHENVYVHDASMLPTSPGTNPQGPIMAMVLRCLKKNFP